MLAPARRVKGFNLIQMILIALWVAVLIYFIATLMVDFLHGTFNLMTAIAGVLMVLVCLPVSIGIHRANPDKEFRRITLGLAEFTFLIVLAGILVYVLPPTFGWYWLAPVGQLLWFGGYGAILIPLYHRMNLQRDILDVKIDVILTVICIIAAVLTTYSIVAQRQALDLNGLNVVVYASFVILDIFLLSILSKLMLVNMTNMYRYFFAILFIFFFLNFLPDVINFYTFLNLKTSVDINYSNPLSLAIFGMAEVFISAALVVYSSRNLSPVTVEEVKETLQDTRRLMNDVIAESPDAICICDVNGKAILANDTFSRFFGLSSREAIGNTNLFDRTLALSLSDEELGRIKNGDTIVLPLVKSPDKKRYLTAKIYPTHTSGGAISGYVATAEDITERTIAEQRIKDSLEEKNVLLKEIHHRVKNNLQIVSSLLNIQASYVTDQTALDCFRDSQQRVKSMALIHEKLYQSQDLSKVKFSEYINNLSAYLFRSYSVNPGHIRFTMEVDDITLDIDRAIPCGLIINELVSNSLKHAFPGDSKGEIRITMRLSGDRYLLEVGDTGTGFPQDLDYRNTRSLGMQLVTTLVAQLEGTIDLDRNTGTKFIIAFPAEKSDSGSIRI